MKDLPILHFEYIPNLVESRLLLDTNFIIESNRYPEKFSELIFYLREKTKNIFTLEVVKKEFLFGVQTKSELNSLEKYFQQLITNLEANTECFSNNLLTATKLYRNFKKKVSLEDFIIVTYLLSHEECVFLTKNHADFPLTFCNRIGFVIVEYENEIQHYAFYQIDSEKVEEILQSFEKTP
jgi:predicted nucleic acid-binding protein